MNDTVLGSVVSPSFEGEYGEIFGPLEEIKVPSRPANAKLLPNTIDGQNVYFVSFVLAPPGMSIGEQAWTIGQEQGDSYLTLRDGNGTSYEGYSFRARVDVPIHFYLLANESGRLGRVTSDDFRAINLQAALLWANDTVNAVLSDLSVVNDIALHVRQVEVFDLTTRTFWSRRLIPTRTRSMGFISRSLVTDDHRLFSNLYREAVTSSSEAYRFLCLFKLLEGLFSRRGGRAKRAKKEKATPQIYVEIVPECVEDQIAFLRPISMFSGWQPDTLEQVFPSMVRGWKFRRVLNEMRPIRDKIAHSLLDNDVRGLSTDQLAASRLLTFWLPLLRVLCRKLLNEEFGMISKTE